jgi:hypothetical protein
MRFIFGIIVGGLLTIGGAYVVDKMSPAGAKTLVNWDVVAQEVDGLTSRAREAWRKISG